MTTTQAKKLAPTMVLKEKPYRYPTNSNIVPIEQPIDMDEINKLLVKEFKYSITDGKLIIQFYNDDLPIHSVKITLHKNHKPMHLIQALILSGCTLME